VGGHHKVPMSVLRKELENLELKQVITLLNSGNIIFEGVANSEEALEVMLSEHLETVFGFPIPTIVVTAETIHDLLKGDPFKKITLTSAIRFYISFLKKEDPSHTLQIPWTSEDTSYTIIRKQGRVILSVLDLSIAKTPKAMGFLEQYFGKDITTRNWNTIKRIEGKL